LKAPADSRVAADHLDSLLRDGDVIVQPYAPSVVRGETSLVFFGGELSHAVRKVPKDGDYRVQALHGGTEEVHEATAGELEVAAAAMALAPDELSYARVDFIEVQGQATLMELELIEPDLFLRTSPGAVERCVGMVESRLLE
jgi:glutathione synthase/RimK-type ligase-like ATP-grasp enzyme